MASAMQALLSNIIVLQEINNALITAIDNDQRVEAAWLVGRAMRLLLVVPPLERIDDYDYDLDNDDFNRLFRIFDKWN